MQNSRKIPSHPFALAVACALALLLAACGGADTIDTGGQLTEEDAAAFSDFARQSADFQMGVLSSPLGMLPGVAPAGISAAQGDCVATVGGAADSDGDGIPDDVTYTWNCSVATDGFDASGSVRLQDSGSGVDMVFDELTLAFEGASFGFDGSVSTSASHPTYTATIDIAFTFSGGGESGSFAYELDQTFTSTAAEENAFDAGTLDFTGSIAVTGGGTSYSLTAESQDLVVEATCVTGFASGSIAWADTEGNALDLEFACDAWIASYNGVPLGATF